MVSRTISELRDSVQRQRRPLLVVLAVTLLAKGSALLPGYSIDDYSIVVDGPRALLVDVLGKGRVGHWLFLKIGLALQAEPNTARILYVCFAILAYACLGLAVVRFWGIGGNGWLAVAAAAMVANHPYTCEIFTFRVGLAPAAIVMALLSLLLFLVCRPRAHLLSGALLVAAALSFYQIALHFAVMILLTGTAIALGQRLRSPAAAEIDREPWWRRALADRNLRLLVCIQLGLGVYIVAAALLGRLIGLKAGYFELVPLSAIPGRVSMGAQHALTTFVRPNLLVPPAVQVAFALVLCALIIGLFYGAARAPARRESISLLIAVSGLLGGALVWSLGVLLIRQEYWLVPRSMAHVSVFWAACVVLAVLTAPARWMRLGVGVAAAVILVSFVAVNQHILDEQLRLNLRDRDQANRIIARLETLPDFNLVRRIAFVGRRPWYPAGLERTQWGDMNISAFGAWWSQVSLLREVSGYDLRWVSDGKENAEARAYCAQNRPWPAATAVTIQRDFGIVCFE